MNIFGTSNHRKDISRLVFVASLFLCLGIFWLDILSPPRNVWTLYVLPLLTIAAIRGLFYPLVLASFCTVLTLVGLHFSPHGISWNYELLDRFFGMSAGWVFVVLTIQRNQANDRLGEQKLNLEMEIEKRRLEETERAKAEKALQKEAEERIRIEEQLRQSQKMESLGTLAGGIAHDFNNILAIILGNAELGLDDLEEKELLQENLERIVKASERGKDLVRQILAFSRKTPQRREHLHLVPLLRETCTFLRASLPANILIEFNTETDGDEIVADPSQIQQVLMNLATNAVDAMHQRGGLLKISLSETVLPAANRPPPEPDMSPGPYFKLAVKDTGTGMTAQVRKRVFEPFFTTKEVGKGTGLGLSVVYGIVKGQGGGITVESKRGKGTIFRVFLPRGAAPLLEQEERKEATYAGSGRILFVDDEPELAAPTRLILEHLGYTVTMTTDPFEAWQVFKTCERPFDLVITDQTMPKMTGIALAQKMLDLHKNTPIILCTGYSETVSAEEAEAMGIGFLMKPTSKKELAEMVMRMMNSRF